MLTNPDQPQPTKPPTWWEKITGPQAAILGVSIYVLAPIVGVILVIAMCCVCGFWGSLMNGAQTLN